MSSKHVADGDRSPGTTTQKPETAPPKGSGGVLARMGAVMATHAKWVFGAWLSL